MRIIDPTLKERMQLAHMTVANNAQPRMEIEAVRPRTPIFHQRFWQEAIVTAGVTATSTSVAVQRSSGRWGQRVYVAYVAGGTLTVKAADLLFPVENLAWSTILTIPNCTGCALEHDGVYEYGDFERIEFHTRDLWLFYTTAAGELMGGILGGTYDNIANSVTSFDAIRGIASVYGDIDQGMIVFYTVSGSVYYKQFVSGAWENQQAVSIAPATTVEVKANRSFDWRIVLHVKDNAGALYEIFTKMEASGWNGTEFISVGISSEISVIAVAYTDAQTNDAISIEVAALTMRLWALPPVIASITNIDDGNGNYGIKVRMTFDELILSVVGNETAFTITDEDDVVWNSTAIEQAGDKTIEVAFQDWNNAVGDVSVAYTPGTLIGEVELVESFVETFTPSGLVPTILPTPEPSLLSNLTTLTIDVVFDKVIAVLGAATGFSVSYYEPAWVPGGDNVLKTYTPSSIGWKSGPLVSQTVALGGGTLTDMEVV